MSRDNAKKGNTHAPRSMMRSKQLGERELRAGKENAVDGATRACYRRNRSRSSILQEDGSRRNQVDVIFGQNATGKARSNT